MSGNKRQIRGKEEHDIYLFIYIYSYTHTLSTSIHKHINVTWLGPPQPPNTKMCFLSSVT